jgi:archaellum component FlaF (FlaF/FlaG flagellin family)
MGFGTVFANVVMISIFLFAMVSLVVTYKGYVNTMRTGVEQQQERASNKVHTNIEIKSAVYDAPNSRIYLKLLNTGSTKLDPGQIDSYVNGVFIPRRLANRTINITRNVINSQFWDPDENVTVNVTYPLWAGDHYIEITTEYGIKDAVIITA